MLTWVTPRESEHEKTAQTCMECLLPRNARNLPFATLLQLAMNVGLGRQQAKSRTGGLTLRLLFSYELGVSGFSSEAVKKWMTGHAIPNEGNASILIKGMTSGERHVQQWFDCLKEASSRDRALSPKERSHRAKDYRFVWKDDLNSWELEKKGEKNIVADNVDDKLPAGGSDQSRISTIAPLQKYIDVRRKTVQSR